MRGIVNPETIYICFWLPFKASVNRIPNTKTSTFRQRIMGLITPLFFCRAFINFI